MKKNVKYILIGIIGIALVMFAKDKLSKNQMETYTLQGITFYGDPYERLDDSYALVTSGEYDDLINQYTSNERVIKCEVWQHYASKHTMTIIWYDDGTVSYQY